MGCHEAVEAGGARTLSSARVSSEPGPVTPSPCHESVTPRDNDSDLCDNNVMKL